ncbi:Embryo-specific ATS3 protein [Dioscorea alata]|uniref:Embryo-specific ATS3 protein n=1 Tax=Dioscorea alata TaxID=55571 RepID=A0ACB7W2F1_DIOAL|nr:Embryo-specific ATS3 protein [Dioscorea alata]
MARSTPFFLLLVFCISSPSSSSSSAVNPKPEELATFKPQDTSKVGGLNNVRGGCSYTVKIKTSCSSPRYTRDMISIAFGDAYRNEVYAPRLDDPSSGAFERCSTDTFKMQGPCGYGVCYLYVRRDGWDGWTPEWVQILETSYHRSVNFYYGSPIPNGVWFGFNNCPRLVTRPTGGAQLVSRMRM